MLGLGIEVCFACDMYIVCPITFQYGPSPVWPNVTVDGLSLKNMRKISKLKCETSIRAFNAPLVKCWITLSGKKVSTKDNIWLFGRICPCSPQHPIKCPGPALLYFERAPLVPLHKPQWSENRHQTMAVECSCNPRYSHNDIKPDVCNRMCSCRLFYDAVL